MADDERAQGRLLLERLAAAGTRAAFVLTRRVASDDPAPPPSPEGEQEGERVVWEVIEERDFTPEEYVSHLQDENARLREQLAEAERRLERCAAYKRDAEAIASEYGHRAVSAEQRAERAEGALVPLDGLIGDLRYWSGMVNSEAVLKKLADVRAALAPDLEAGDGEERAKKGGGLPSGDFYPDTPNESRRADPYGRADQTSAGRASRPTGGAGQSRASTDCHFLRSLRWRRGRRRPPARFVQPASTAKSN